MVAHLLEQLGGESRLPDARCAVEGDDPAGAVPFDVCECFA